MRGIGSKRGVALRNVIDTRKLPPHIQQAIQVQRLGRIDNFPAVAGWNPDLPLMPHQQVAAAWQFFIQRGVNADQVGLGKMISTFGIVGLLRALGEPYRTIVCCEPNVQRQWVEECARFLPDIDICLGRGKPEERHYLYKQRWDVLVTTYPLLRRDYEHLRALKRDLVAFDESSNFRHHGIMTHDRATLLSYGVPRILLLDGTPIQNELIDLHAQLEALHLPIFGPRLAFELRFVVREARTVKRGNRFINELPILRYKNVDEFKARIAPFILRRTKDQVDEQLPEIVVEDYWFDLPPRQRDLYDQVQRDHPGQQHLLQYACDTSAAFGDDPSVSVKLDFLLRKLQGDIRNEPVIVFSRYKEALFDARRRLTAAGIRSGLYTGEQGRQEREATVDKFNRGQIRVLLGTEALERGINLQRSAYMFAINQLDNPQRMQQLAGRMRRLSSARTHVYLINLRANDTFEAGQLHKSRKRASVPDFVFEEQNDVFQPLSETERQEYIR